MILSSLVDLYEVLAQKGEIPKNGWSKVKLSFALSLNLQGELIGIIDLRKEVERGKKKVIVPGERSMPSPVKRSSGVAANFLWDNSSYILGADEKGSPDKAEKKFNKAHLNRVKNQKCDPAMTGCFSGILYNLDRAADNCVSIAEEALDN